MILVDSNLLVYAHISSFPQHERARDWLDGKLNETARVGLPWPSLLTFARLVCSRHILSPPEPISRAWRQIEDWLGCPSVWVPPPTERHAEILGSCMQFVGQNANLVPDAHLAALAIEHGLTLCSTDGDFARFPSLRWENPLA
jgi:toxin-antitoxin system PIN domain toxin